MRLTEATVFTFSRKNISNLTNFQNNKPIIKDGEAHYDKYKSFEGDFQED